ncbi:hypothetical protein pqer_cds_101 [Pandoravirus quercus]|uniref:Uncharacterized protein n=1 Tax=Pandoravirus quercus TaxID=2107709 RepID=A0A2U7U7X2_9VIRU|nr:hypothetical protein pqer_cds_101 [Pandoravirus quercus]AVK74523.1 hypothetical protein pqer_cds_101 [Pandoravirus quercus]
MQVTSSDDSDNGYDRGLYDDSGLYDDGNQYEDALYDQQVYYDDNGEQEQEEEGEGGEEEQQYAPRVSGSAEQGLSADLVDLLGVDVFDALVRSLLADGRAADAAALCSSSQRARRVCQASRANWARDFPDLESAYGALAMVGPPRSAVSSLAGMPGNGGGGNNDATRYSLLQTALAGRRVDASARLRQQRVAGADRFCALYALYARDQTIRVASERQRAHARDVESGAASQVSHMAPYARPTPAPVAPTRTRGIGQALRRVVPRSLRGSLSFRQSLQREVAPHPDVVDVLRSPATVSLEDLEEWARGLTDISGYPTGMPFAGFEPWAIVQLGDEPPVPFDADAGPLFFVTGISPPRGAVASLNDKRLEEVDRRTGATPNPRDLIRADLNKIARSSAQATQDFRSLVRRRVNQSLLEALYRPIRIRVGPAWETKKRGVQRPARPEGRDDPSEATLEALRRLVGRCEQIDVFSAYAPVSTYLAARPFGAHDLVEYDIIIRLPLREPSVLPLADDSGLD